MEKTNVMRLLEQKKVPYTPHCYADTDALSALEVAQVLGQNPNQVFKTLVTQAKNAYYVFAIPASAELDLKKAAKAVNQKSLEMLHLKELYPLTGYVHGGCSPLGMKKFFKTTFHQSAPDFKTIIFSAGKIGYQVELKLSELQKIIPLQTADVIK